MATMRGNYAKGPGFHHKGGTRSEEPMRYTYAKPTEKPQHGKPAYPGRDDIFNYKLPITDVDTDTSVRNFPSYTKKEYFDLVDIQEGESQPDTFFKGGTTETDSVTATKGSGGYTRVYSKANSQRTKVGRKSSPSGAKHRR